MTKDKEISRQAPDGVPAVRLTGLSKRFGATVVLDDVTLDFRRGEATVLIGASGSGKTSLLRCLIGLSDPDSGTIEIDGEPVVEEAAGGRSRLAANGRAIRRRKLGMVFQSYNLFPHRTAIENIIEAPIYARGIQRGEAIARAEELLRQVGLLDRRDHYPSQLSGGQQQRVAIARALAMDPEVILFDEVTSALDPELTGEVLTTMSELARTGLTMIVVTHEMGFARHVADRVVFMESGRIVEAGPPDQVLMHPEHERTRRFLSKVLHLRE
ncbi:MAG: amino acid ABC transporter ATP-binding protein [Parvibaculaceae bacterium]